MGHVPKGLDHQPSANHPVTKKYAANHGGGPGAVAYHGDHNSIPLGGDQKHCHEEGCTKAPSYGWASASGAETSVAIMCAKVRKSTAVSFFEFIYQLALSALINVE